MSTLSPFRRQQAMTIGTIYLAYATSMILRMIPTVAGNSIKSDGSLGIDIDQWTKVLSAGTVGALVGKFLCGWAADKFGGHRTFAVALFVASLFVAMFALSSSLLMMQITFFITLMAQAAGWPSMTRIIVNWVEPAEYGRVWGILSTSSRVGTLTATFLLGSTLAWFSWRSMLGIASALGFGAAFYYALFMKERPATLFQAATPADGNSRPDQATDSAHPFDGLTLLETLPRFVLCLRFWLICFSLMGLTILWDFLLMVPIYLKDTLNFSEAQASRAASAFPFGSLISVLVGGFVFDKLNRRTTAWIMAGLLLGATGCLLAFPALKSLNLPPDVATAAPIGLLFLFGICVSPCYYIPSSVFSIDFGGPHSGFLVAILDAVGFAATAVFYYFVGGIIKKSGWNDFIDILAVICGCSALATFLFMHRHARLGIRKRRIA